MSDQMRNTNEINNKALDTFGEFLMREVRDTSISDMDSIMEGRMKGVGAQSVYKRLSGLTSEQREALISIVPFLVDQTLSHLLWALEQTDIINVSVKVEEHAIPSVRLVSDGLVGELYGDVGWIARYSHQRDSLDSLKELPG